MKQSHCLVYSCQLRYAQVKWSVSDAVHVVMLSLIPRRSTVFFSVDHEPIICITWSIVRLQPIILLCVAQFVIIAMHAHTLF